ncbi:MAG: hypothetical protein ABUL48_05735 [Pseudorhodoplanes sp.]
MTKKPNDEARTFFVNTRFQIMARRPGGVPRERAIERAQTNINELKPGFADWLDNKLPEMTAAIRQIERDSGDAALLDEAYWNCCQLRDVGATMGFELLTHISDNLCKILKTMKAGSAYQKESIECHIDALILASKAPYCNLHPDQLPEMTSGLRRVVERAGGSQPK